MRTDKGPYPAVIAEYNCLLVCGVSDSRCVCAGSIDMAAVGLLPYRFYLDQHRDADRPDEVIRIDLLDFEISGDMHVLVEGDTVVTGERGAITWAFSVEKEGLYSLEIEYLTPEGKSSSVQREIRLDGEIPFEGAHQILFSRIWVDEGPIIKKRDNEIRPNQVEAFEWQTGFVSDSQKYIPGPFEFYLSEGTHKLTLVSVREPLQIRKLEFKQAPKIPTYEEYIADKLQKYDVYAGPNIKFQAERTDGEGNHTVAIQKSSPTLHAVQLQQLRLEPATLTTYA